MHHRRFTFKVDESVAVQVDVPQDVLRLLQTHLWGRHSGTAISQKVVDSIPNREPLSVGPSNTTPLQNSNLCSLS